MSTYLPLPVEIKGPLTPFGRVLTAEEVAVVQTSSVYGLSTEEHETFSASGGTAEVDSNRLFSSSCTSTLGSYGVVRTRRATRYRPGQGVISRFTALFSEPVANTQQMAGSFSAENGLFFGYNGTQFGVMRQYGGALEIQTLTMSAGASGTESVTIVLNGATGVTFNLLSGTAAANAATIAAQSYTGWEAFQREDTVVFIAQSVGDKTSTFSFTNNTGGGTAAGSFAETQAGAAHTEDWIYQSDWNIDRMDGTGGIKNPSQMTLDPSKGNVFQIGYQWLGFGAIEFFIKDPSNNKIQLVHRIGYSNQYTVPSIANPALKVGWVAYNLGGPSGVTVKGASCATFVAGSKQNLRDAHGISFTKTGVGTTLVPIISIRCGAEYRGRINLGAIEPILASIAIDGTKPAEVQLIADGTLSGTPNWTSVSTHTAADYDTSASGISGGVQVIGFGVGKTSDRLLDLTALKSGILLERTGVLTIAAKATSGTTDVTASLTWIDD